MKEQKSLELIDRYVAAVGRRLPGRVRADVEAELRSTLLDTLEDRSSGADRPADEALVRQVLEEMGPPELMAAQYSGNRALIGPQLYPTFILVCKIVLGIVVAAQAFGLLVALLELDHGVWTVIGQSLAALPASLFGSIGLLVVIFALLERYVPGTARGAGQAFDPLKLPAVDEPNLVRPAGPIVEVVLTLAAIVLVNFYREWMGMNLRQGGVWHHYPFLTPAFAGYVLALNVLWGLSILHNLALLVQGEWRQWTRWAKIGLTLFGMVILVAMIGGEPIAHIPGLDLLLTLILALQAVDLARQLIHLLRLRRDLLTFTLRPRDGDGGR